MGVIPFPTATHNPIYVKIFGPVILRLKEEKTFKNPKAPKEKSEKTKIELTKG